MTGPEHYRKAEGLAANAWRKVGADESVYLHDAGTRDRLLAAAQVHATLAQTAAIIDSAGYNVEIRREDEWSEVLR